VVAAVVQHNPLALVQTVETVDNLQLIIQLHTDQAVEQVDLVVLEVQVVEQMDQAHLVEDFLEELIPVVVDQEHYLLDVVETEEVE
jgi:S-adenosylmethionine synthetase